MILGLYSGTDRKAEGQIGDGFGFKTVVIATTFFSSDKQPQDHLVEMRVVGAVLPSQFGTVDKVVASRVIILEQMDVETVLADSPEELFAFFECRNP